MIIKYLAQGTYHMLSAIYQNKEQRNLILDPLSTIIRLGILSFKPEGTKISIYGNRMTFHEPNYLQGLLRTFQGDNREDLHNLFKPIRKATEWYNAKDDPILDNLFKLSIQGLLNLKDSYQDGSTISYTLDHYIDTINARLSNSNPNLVEESEDVSLLHQSLKNIWNRRTIEIINNLFLEISSKKDQNCQKLLDSVETILEMQDQQVVAILETFSTKL